MRFKLPRVGATAPGKAAIRMRTTGRHPSPFTGVMPQQFGGLCYKLCEGRPDAGDCYRSCGSDSNKDAVY
jgi:hypothetical protein